MKNSFYLLSLGCPKNEVDAEAMSALLKDSDFHFSTNPEEADFLIVNTCAFIDDAKREAISAILELAEVKEKALKAGKKQYLVVTGCLSQRYAKEIASDLPEVDACLGTAEYSKIVSCCRELWEQGKSHYQIPEGRGGIEHLERAHMPSGDQAFAWLKIAEGCSNGCAFCAIPSIRGKLRSRPPEAIEAEARLFAKNGFHEQIVIAQDCTQYGLDLSKRQMLPELLRRLVSISGLDWIRLLYLYGDGFSDELIELMASQPKILHYLDIPIQHASDRVLQRMRRKETARGLRELIKKLRSAMPDIILRSTVMLGFPGETEEDFDLLLDFLEEIQFDRLGAFVYSPEEGTLAVDFPDQVPVELAQERYEKVMELQKGISLTANRRRISQTCDILLEGVSDDGLFFTGRSYGEAPGIDPLIYLAAQSPDLRIGDFVAAKIVDADAYSLTAVSERKDVL